MKYALFSSLVLLLSGALSAEDPAGRFQDLVSTMAPDAAEERMALAHELGALGAPRAAVRALEKTRNRSAQAVAAVLSPKVADGIVKLVEQSISDSRKELLAFVMDEKRYPESKSPTAQAEVDRLVGVIRTVWNDPIQVALETSPDLVERLAKVDPEYARIRELDALRAALIPGSDPSDLGTDTRAALTALVFEARIPPAWRAVLEANTASAYLDDEEQSHLVIVNDYRMMLGLAPLESDVRLWRGARGHSRDMDEHGFFSHTSPIPGKHTPFDRGALEGYPKTSGENIFRGHATGRVAFERWYLSPGHHRNMLAARDTQVGIGRHGVVWTQLFGSGEGFAGRKKPPQIVLEETIAALPSDCPADQRVEIARQAANFKLFILAEAQLALAAKQEPDDEKIRDALNRVRKALEK